MVASTAACGLTCNPGTVRCNGDDVEQCPYGSDNIGPMVEYCVACKELSIGATCVDSRSPVSACANVANGSEVCWSGNPSMCQDGYPTPDSATPPCDPSSVCVAASGKIFCALSTDPDPACPSDPAVQVCDGQYLLACELGYATSRSTCPSPTVCTVQSAGGATCM